MCNHKFKDDITQRCKWNIFFKEKVAIELPHDSKGKCIFHSNDLQWKRENSFTQWLVQLISLLDQCDVENDVIELDDIILAGDSLLENQNSKYRFRTNADNELYCILFENLICRKHIVLRNAICQDPVILERCLFKQDLIITDCSFTKGISINHLIVGQDFQLLNCHFKNNIVTDSDNIVFDSWYINNSTFDGDTSFSGLTIYDSSVIDENIFNHITSNTNFNCCFGGGLEFRNNKCSDIGFDRCDFYYDNIFCNLELSGRFLMTQPEIGGQLKFVGEEDKFLFNTQTTIEIDSNSFEGNGLITFDYCNLIDLGTVFIANCRELESKEKIRILPSCKVERLTIIHVYKPYKELKSNIIEDLAHIITRYFRHWHSIDLSVNIIRNRIESSIKVIFKTTDDISEEHFKSLLHEFPATVCNPPENTPEATDIKQAFTDILSRLSACKVISKSEKAEILNFNLDINIMAKDINLAQSQIGMLFTGNGNNIQGNHIELNYLQDSNVDFSRIQSELEKLENEIKKSQEAELITTEQLKQLQEAVALKDKHKLIQYLKKLPGAFFKFAQNVGANVLAGMFQQAIGL